MSMRRNHDRKNKVFANIIRVGGRPVYSCLRCVHRRSQRRGSIQPLCCRNKRPTHGRPTTATIPASAFRRSTRSTPAM